MKKSVFILLILLFSFSLMYSGKGFSGIERVSAQGESCFSENSFGLVNRLVEKRSAGFVFESIPQKWEFEILRNEVKLKTTNFASGEMVLRDTLVKEQGESNEFCKYYTFEYERKKEDLVFVLDFESENDIEEGKRCMYDYSIIEEELGSELFGYTLAKNFICPDLVGGIREAGSGSCPTTAKCEVSIPQGEKETFGFMFSKDSCGNRLVREDNNGLSFESSEINVRAKEFVDYCMGIDKSAVRRNEIISSCEDYNEAECESDPQGFGNCEKVIIYPLRYEAKNPDEVTPSMITLGCRGEPPIVPKLVLVEGNPYFASCKTTQ